ncbi:MAG: hypothetical protein AAFR27_15640 [Pseudomonadota bacterium]
MSIDSDGNRFSGVAGQNWSDEDIRRFRNNTYCPADKTVANIEITRLEDGTAQFSGDCV